MPKPLLPLALLALATPVLAQQAPQEKAPSPEAVRQVWEFWFRGQGGGVVLADAQLCLELAKEGPEQNQCARPVPPEGVKPGTTVYVWQAYMLPQGDKVEDLTVQLLQGDTVRETKDVTVEGRSFRQRTWQGFRIPKAGDWRFVIRRGGEVLRTLELKATK